MFANLQKLFLRKVCRWHLLATQWILNFSTAWYVNFAEEGKLYSPDVTWCKQPTNYTLIQQPNPSCCKTNYLLIWSFSVTVYEERVVRDPKLFFRWGLSVIEKMYISRKIHGKIETITITNYLMYLPNPEDELVEVMLLLRLVWTLDHRLLLSLTSFQCIISISVLLIL